MGQTTEEEFPNSVSWCPLRVGSWVVGGVFLVMLDLILLSINQYLTRNMFKYKDRSMSH